MSRIGKKGVTIPTGTTVTQNDTVFTVKGPLGELTRDFSGPVDIKVEGNTISFSPKNSSKEARALWGTCASHLVNMVAGVNTAFAKKLIIEGVGYKVEPQGATL